VQYVDSSFEPPMRGGMVEAYLLTEFCPGIGPLWCQVAAALTHIAQEIGPSRCDHVVATFRTKRKRSVQGRSITLGAHHTSMHLWTCALNTTTFHEGARKSSCMMCAMMSLQGAWYWMS
jgi:hypothetical protein